VGDARIGRQLDVAAVGFELTQEGGEQRRLAAAVGADQTEALAGVHLKRGVREQQSRAAAQGDSGQA
jgi:hypothetical protein